VRVVFDRYAYIEIRARIRSNAYSHSRGPQSKTLLQLSARVIKDSCHGFSHSFPINYFILPEILRPFAKKKYQH
jgi:hypothetical protein